MNYSYPEFSKKWIPVMEGQTNEIARRYMWHHLRNLRISWECGVEPMIVDQIILSEILGVSDDTLRSSIAKRVPREFTNTIAYLQWGDNKRGLKEAYDYSRDQEHKRRKVLQH